MSRIRTARTHGGDTIVVATGRDGVAHSAVARTPDEAAVAASADAFVAARDLAGFFGQPRPAHLVAWLVDDGVVADDGREPPRRLAERPRARRPWRAVEPPAPPGPATVARLRRALTEAAVDGVDIAVDGEVISLVATGWRDVDRLLRSLEALGGAGDLDPAEQWARTGPRLGTRRSAPVRGSRR